VSTNTPARALLGSIGDIWAKLAILVFVCELAAGLETGDETAAGLFATDCTLLSVAELVVDEDEEMERGDPPAALEPGRETGDEGADTLVVDGERDCLCAPCSIINIMSSPSPASESTN